MELGFDRHQHWHGKSFRFSWDIPDAWGVIIHYHNGERREWYRRTERSYRFQRWFFRGGQGVFRNIAHRDFPELTLYVFRGYSLVPKKIRIPMQVRTLNVNRPEIDLSRPWFRGVSFAVNLLGKHIKCKPQKMQLLCPDVKIIRLGEPEIRITDVPEYTMGLTEITK